MQQISRLAEKHGVKLWSFHLPFWKYDISSASMADETVAFKEINYSGVWLYEVGFGCPKTIYRERRLTCEDFVNNANEIFENKPISVFSKPKENLGMWE